MWTHPHALVHSHTHMKGTLKEPLIRPVSPEFSEEATPKKDGSSVHAHHAPQFGHHGLPAKDYEVICKQLFICTFVLLDLLLSFRVVCGRKIELLLKVKFDVFFFLSSHRVWIMISATMCLTKKTYGNTAKGYYS